MRTFQPRMSSQVVAAVAVAVFVAVVVAASLVAASLVAASLVAAVLLVASLAPSSPAQPLARTLHSLVLAPTLRSFPLFCLFFGGVLFCVEPTFLI